MVSLEKTYRLEWPELAGVPGVELSRRQVLDLHDKLTSFVNEHYDELNQIEV